MSWNYRIILHDLDPDPTQHWYGLHEVHYGMPDDPSKPGIGPTKQPITFVCGLDEGKDGIIGALERALATLRNPRWGVVLTDSGMAQGIGREAGREAAYDVADHPWGITGQKVAGHCRVAGLPTGATVTQADIDGQFPSIIADILARTEKRRWLCTACSARMILEEWCQSGILPDATTRCDVCDAVGKFELMRVPPNV